LQVAGAFMMSSIVLRTIECGFEEGREIGCGCIGEDSDR
jgi:hypothetical protein